MKIEIACRWFRLTWDIGPDKRCKNQDCDLFDMQERRCRFHHDEQEACECRNDVSFRHGVGEPIPPGECPWPKEKP